MHTDYMSAGITAKIPWSNSKAIRKKSTATALSRLLTNITWLMTTMSDRQPRTTEWRLESCAMLLIVSHFHPKKNCCHIVFALCVRSKTHLLNSKHHNCYSSLLLLDGMPSAFQLIVTVVPWFFIPAAFTAHLTGQLKLASIKYPRRYGTGRRRWMGGSGYSRAYLWQLPQKSHQFQRYSRQSVFSGTIT